MEWKGETSTLLSTKALKSHLFTPLFMFIHLPLIYFAPPPRLLIDFKNSKWLTYFCILLCICYCFSHLIGLRSVTWLFLLYKFTRFFHLFSVSLWRRANARNVRLYYSYWQYTDLFIFRFVSLLCLRSTLRLYLLVNYLLVNNLLVNYLLVVCWQTICW